MSNYPSLGNEKEIDKLKCYVSPINILEYRKKCVRKGGKKSHSVEYEVLNTSMEENGNEKGICLRVGWHRFFSVLGSERRPLDRITPWLNVFYPRIHCQQNAEV